MQMFLIIGIVLLLGSCGSPGKITSEKKEKIRKENLYRDSLSVKLRKLEVTNQAILLRKICWSKPDSAGTQYMESTTEAVVVEDKEKRVAASVQKKKETEEMQQSSQFETIKRNKAASNRVLWAGILIVIIIYFVKKKWF